jgi:hypothetical protein
MTISKMVLSSLESGKTQAIHIMSHQKSMGNEIAVKKIYGALQRLRKAGKAKYENGLWKSVSNA